jgi:hypothetical protein
LVDEVSWWRTDDLWFWALQALVTYVRAAAEYCAEPVPAVCGRIARRHDVQLATDACWLGRLDRGRQEEVGAMVSAYVLVSVGPGKNQADTVLVTVHAIPGVRTTETHLVAPV